MAFARVRLLVAVVAGLAVGAAVGVGWLWPAGILAGWSTTAGVFFVWTIAAIWRCDADATAALATREDTGRALADLLLVSAATASIAAIALGLRKASKASGSTEGVLMALAGLTVVLSWFTVHTVYILRYARTYYSDAPGGVEFNERDGPDYHDFAYLALTIGMTFQVSDTNLTSKPIRRLATRHALMSYLFGAVVLATAINVFATLINK
jgi:uncharacterized membrane protein